MKTSLEYFESKSYLKAFLTANLEFFKNWLNFEERVTRFQFNSVYFGMAFLILSVLLPMVMTIWFLAIGVGYSGGDNFLSLVLMLIVFLSAIVFTAVYLVGFLALSWRRARDCGLPPVSAICVYIPFLNFIYCLILILKPTVDKKIPS